MLCQKQAAPEPGEAALDALLLAALSEGRTVRDAEALAAERLGLPKKQAYARALALRED